MIAEEYEDRIIEEVNRSSIKNQSLKDDLIDHLYCLVEMKMNNGVAFKDAYQSALEQTAPRGLDQIQNETIFLLNYTKIMLMKRFTFVSGYLFALTWVAGISFKLLHIWGAGMLLGIGGIGLAFIFFPLLIINRYKHLAGEVMTERLKWILGSVALILLVTSISMKMLHLMGAGLMLGASFLVFGFGFLPFLFFRMYKQSITEL